ncbi:ABC transporter permease [Haloferula sp.]|uniref:ABC transporter permease n=1 Tax=Haloferula sp. TaxID=2497595 RepID=UPI003C70BFA9
MPCLSESIGQRWLPADWRGRFGLIIALLVTATVLSILRPHFLSSANLVNVVRQISINGILAVGVTFVLLTGGVDLSLGSVVALAGVLAAQFAHPGDYPLVVPLGVGVLTGLACGAVNGGVVTFGKVAPFIATLGMMTIARGLALVFSGGRPVSNMSPAMKAVAGDVAGIPIPALILLAVAVTAWWVLKFTRIGRHLYAVGGNEQASRAAGIDVGRVKMFAYAVCGALTGLAGVVLASRITTGQPNAGIAYELDAIAAVVIGGTSLSGGIGTIGGTILGALLMGVIGNGLDLLNVSSYYQQVVKGLIIVGAVWLDQRHLRKA